jgi:hypothetical protein
VGRNSAVGIATRYGLEGQGIETRWEAKFSAAVHAGPEAHPVSYTRGPGSVLWVKRPGLGVDHTPTSADLRERLELHLYSPSWPVLG